MTSDEEAVKVTRPAPRQVRMFTTRPVISFNEDRTNERTIMELVAGDRPGLLSMVGQAFIEFDVNIETAKILTIGERAEDVFYVVDGKGNPLSDETCQKLRKRLVERIEAMD